MVKSHKDINCSSFAMQTRVYHCLEDTFDGLTLKLCNQFQVRRVLMGARQSDENQLVTVNLTKYNSASSQFAKTQFGQGCHEFAFVYKAPYYKASLHAK